MATEYFHLLNRGVEKRAIVLNDKDRLRFIHDLYVFNDAGTVMHATQPRRRDGLSIQRELLVDIHAFCLMDNHYHLLVSELVTRGISLFMKKLNMGYAKYFNEKYKRSGSLWQGKHKKVPVTRDAHFLYIPYYIHLNPLDYSMPHWRSGKIKDAKTAFERLHAYRWSSHLDYLGEKNFPSVINQKDLGAIFESRTRYQKEITSIISSPDLAATSVQIEN